MIKKRNDAVTAVISVSIALMIVSSIVVSVVLWGVPYMEELEETSKEEEVDHQFVTAVDAINELANSNPGNRKINTIETGEGNVYVNRDVDKDKTIISYSYNKDYDFYVSGLDSGNCFLSGTKVLMADGVYKNIEDITTGDMVSSFDEKTGKVLSSRVSKVFSFSAEKMTSSYYLIINNDLRVTPDHRFYSDNEWVFADDLEIGDPLFPRDLHRVYQVYSVERVYEREACFDLQVENCHNYFVRIATDDADVLVHNDNDPETEYIWVTPDWYGTSGRWVEKGKARDDNNNTESTFGNLIFQKGWSDYLVLEMDFAIPCSGFQINTKWNEGIDTMEITMWNGDNLVKTTTYSSWNNHPEWQQCDYSTNYNVDRVKIRFYNPDQFFDANKFKVYEFDFKVPVPECQTLAATDINETSAKLNGKVTDSQGLDCYYYFRYDTNEAPLNSRTHSSGPIGDDETFSKQIPSDNPTEPDKLKAGELYYFKAVVKHGWVENDGYGQVLKFITSPYPPSNLQYTSTNETISFSWTKASCGSGATIYTKVVANTSGWPSGPEDDTAMLWYNGTGSSKTINNLDPGVRYNVSLYSWVEEGDIGRWGEARNVTMFTRPSVVKQLQVDNISAAEIELTWVKGEGADKTVIRRSTDSYPSDPSEGVEIFNGTGEYYVDTVDPVKTYYYSAWSYSNESQFFSDSYDTAEIEMTFRIYVKSPRDAYRWLGLTTQTIEWAYGDDLADTKVNITLHKSSGGTQYIKDNVNINTKIYTWNIPPVEEHGIYRIKISSNYDHSVFDYSDYFYIYPLHEGYVDNVSINNLNIDQGSEDIYLPSQSYKNKTIENNEYFTLNMNKGETTRVEIYWLSFQDEDIQEPYSLSGAVCIDLYDGSLWLGSIWIIESDSLTYEYLSGGGNNRLTIENGAIVRSESNNVYIQKKPSVYERNKLLSVHLVQIVASNFSAGGSQHISIKLHTNLYYNFLRESGDVYYLRFEFYGDNAETWLDYFTDNYKFEEVEGTNILFYTPSLASKISFAFAHSAIELSFQ